MDCEVVIVGAGFGGMGVAIQLQRMGVRSMLILERASGLGGTWHHNRYPGVAVDVPSVTYCYSFEPNPFWSRTFAAGAEIERYAHHVADKYGLRRYMRFGVSVEQVVYDERMQRWNIHADGRPTITARILVLAIGYLSRPKYPNIPGLGDFRGKCMHSAAWDSGYDVAGRRVATIGTGASAVQLLPAIAPRVARLDVYQRTPIWCGPKHDVSMPVGLQHTFAKLPASQQMLRLASNAQLDLWTIAALFNERAPWVTDAAERGCRTHIATAVRDPALRHKLTPDYPFLCKRPTISNDYYPMFNRPNVALITDPIDHIEPDGIVTRDGTKRCVDALLLATGFDVWKPDRFHSIVGVGGVELREYWHQAGFQSYEGITIPGFPNLFYLPGPYSYAGVSYFFTMESQAQHIARVVSEMRRRGARSVEASRAATASFVERMRARFAGTVFDRGRCSSANSFYFDSLGQPSLVRPETVHAVRAAQFSFPLNDYHFA